MGEYSKDIFLSLTEKRRLEILLSAVQKAERVWPDLALRESFLKNVKNYLLWLTEDPQLSLQGQKISHLFRLLTPRMEQRTLFDIAVPIERTLNLSIKEDEFLNVTNYDQPEKPRVTLPLVIILDHLRSAFNVGSIFRSADGLGIEHLYLVGYTPTPLDPGVLKTTMGSERSVAWSHWDQMDILIKDLKTKNYHLVALETLPEAITLGTFKAPKPMALFLGNERFGLDQKILKQMDEIVSIEMRGIKNSLNVANAMSIFSYEVSRQWQI